MLIDLSTIKERSCANIRAEMYLDVSGMIIRYSWQMYNQPHPRRSYLLWKQWYRGGRWKDWECLGIR